MTESGCQQCRENTYSGDGAESCTSCPDGKLSSAGSTSTEDCEYGYSFENILAIKKYKSLKKLTKMTPNNKS